MFSFTDNLLNARGTEAQRQLDPTKCACTTTHRRQTDSQDIVIAFGAASCEMHVDTRFNDLTQPHCFAPKDSFYHHRIARLAL